MIELSALLQRMPLHAPMDRGETFRDPDGVARKTRDIATAHPDYKGRPPDGGQTDKEVLATFLRGPARMRAVAAAIRYAVESGNIDDAGPAEDLADEDIEAPEGRLLLRQHLSRERSAEIRRRKVDTVLEATGRLAPRGLWVRFRHGIRGTARGVHHCPNKRWVVSLRGVGRDSARYVGLAKCGARAVGPVLVDRPDLYDAVTLWLCVLSSNDHLLRSGGGWAVGDDDVRTAGSTPCGGRPGGAAGGGGGSACHLQLVG